MKRKKYTQIQQVIDTLREQGGYATLGNLYHLVDTSTWATKTPNESIRRIILASTKKADKVLDPFCGSGTTGIAANLLERDFVGIEREHEYVEMSRRRRLEIDNPLTAESYRTRIKDIDFIERCELMV